MAEPGLFRDEAVAHKARAAGTAHGRVLRLSPTWVDGAYRAVAVCAVLAAIFVAFARVGDDASGPAVVQFDDRRAVTAAVTGTVAKVAVAPGDRVQAGDPLVVMQDGLDQAEIDRTERAFQAALVEFLRDPTNETLRADVARARGDREAAQGRTDAKVVRAPVEGLVSDLYAMPGQALVPGDLVASLRQGESAPAVVALLPGRVRPLLAKGMVLELVLPGFELQPREAVVESVGGEVVGPAQALRSLGVEATDAIAAPGPSVVVRARLSGSSFDDRGQPLPYFHGMTGEATVRVRSEPLIVAMFPALRRWWGVFP